MAQEMINQRMMMAAARPSPVTCPSPSSDQGHSPASSGGPKAKAKGKAGGGAAAGKDKASDGGKKKATTTTKGTREQVAYKESWEKRFAPPKRRTASERALGDKGMPPPWEGPLPWEDVGPGSSSSPPTGKANKGKGGERPAKIARVASPSLVEGIQQEQPEEEEGKEVVQQEQGDHQAVTIPKVEGTEEQDEVWRKRRSLIGTSTPTYNGVVLPPSGVDQAMVTQLRQHFDELKRTHMTIQGLSRAMKKGVFQEMWRPFDSSKTWPMCIFYRNPDLPQAAYRTCRSGLTNSYGDATSPRFEDPVWNDLLKQGLVDPLVSYMKEHAVDLELGDKVPFSIQALWYDSATAKAPHKDPQAYSVIAALNIQGDADLSLHEQGTHTLHQSLAIPEGSMYIMHNSSILHYDHAVSAPHTGGARDNRVTLILRFVDRLVLDRLLQEIPKMTDNTPSIQGEEETKKPTSNSSTTATTTTTTHHPKDKKQPLEQNIKDKNHHKKAPPKSPTITGTPNSHKAKRKR